MFDYNLVTFNLLVILVILFDFFVLTRKSQSTLSLRLPIILLVISTLYIYNHNDNSYSLIEGLALYTMLSFTYLFGYFNSVAFIKRSITFSLLLNHSRPPPRRTNDLEFIDLQLRIKELEVNNWITVNKNKLSITKTGNFVLKLYKIALRILGVKPIG